MQLVVRRRSLKDSDEADDLRYWLSRPAEERFAAVDRLRREWYGDQPRFQRVVRISKLSER